MWRMVVLVIICVIFVVSCDTHIDDHEPAWDEPTAQPPAQPPAQQTPASTQAARPEEQAPFAQTAVSSQTTVTVPNPSQHVRALRMAELLSTPAAPALTRAITPYMPPPPQPFMRGAEATEFGIQINACDHGVDQTLPVLKQLHVRWVKLQVRWGDMQTSGNSINWACMDAAIPALNQNGFKVLASVVTAPAFLRVLPSVNGPPDNFDAYAIFVHMLLMRYRGMIQAVEVWNEPNLSVEWDWQIDGAVYRQLLASAYLAIKAVDPSIVVISGALAPTGYDSVWTHVDDRGFIAKFRRYNGDSFTDCVGAHANGPDSVGNIDRVASNYYDWFDQTKPICVTEFGYALPVQGQAPKGFAWIMSHTVAEQVSTITDGITWASSSGFVRLVIVWNLDYWGSPSDFNAPYALLRPEWESPALARIAQMLQPSR